MLTETAGYNRISCCCCCCCSCCRGWLLATSRQLAARLTPRGVSWQVRRHQQQQQQHAHVPSISPLCIIAVISTSSHHISVVLLNLQAIELCEIVRKICPPTVITRGRTLQAVRIYCTSEVAVTKYAWSVEVLVFCTLIPVILTWHFNDFTSNCFTKNTYACHGNQQVSLMFLKLIVIKS